MTTGGGDTRTRSSIFWAMVFSRGDRRIGSASTSSTSARPFPTKRGNRSARRFEAGICIYAVTRPSKICRGCSIQRSVAGCNITGGIIARRCIPICVNWTARWPIGRIGNTKSCAVIYGGRHIGLRAFPGVIRSCSLTGRWACGVAPWREPYELRGSSTVLREPRGEIPRGYSPHHPGEDGRGGEPGAAPEPATAGSGAPGIEPGEDADHGLRARVPVPGRAVPGGRHLGAVEIRTRERARAVHGAAAAAGAPRGVRDGAAAQHDGTGAEMGGGYDGSVGRGNRSLMFATRNGIAARHGIGA